MSNGGSTARPMLALNKWHPGDAHVHSIYSALDISQIARWARYQHPIVGSLLIYAAKKWNKKAGEGESNDKKRVYNIEGTGRCRDFPPLMESRQLHWVVLTDHGPNMGFPAIQKKDIKKVKYRGRHYRRDFQERAADDLIDNHPADLLGYSMDIARKRWERRQGELDGLGQECCLVGGEELSDLWRYGHMLAYASPVYVYDDPNPDMVLYELLEFLKFREACVIKRIKEKKRDCQREYLHGLEGARKNDQRVFGYIAHPLSRGHSWEGFERELQRIGADSCVKGFELFNDKSPQPEDELLRIWHENLKAGRRIFVIGGTDCHNKDDWKKCKTKTYAFLPRAGCNLCKNDRDDLMVALREGRTVVSQGPLVVFTARNGAGGPEAGIGGELSVKRGDTVHIEWKASAGDHESMYPTMTYFVGRGDGEQDVPVADFKVPGEFAGIGYVRLKGSNAEGDCYTNPIFLVN